MVGSFRNSGIGQIFVGAIVAAIIGAFVLTGQGTLSGGLGTDCAVEVGDECIDPKEYYAAYGLVSSIGLNEKAAKQLNLRQQIAEGLVERELLLGEAKRLGIAASDDAVEEQLADGRTRVSLPADGAERLALSLALCLEEPGGCAPGTIGVRALPVKKDGTLDYELYKRIVRVTTGRSPNHFKKSQRDELTAERVRELVRSRVRVSEEETFLAYSRARSKVTTRNVELHSPWFARFAMALSDDEVDQWAVEHKDVVDAAFTAQPAWTAGCPVVSEIRLDVDAGASEDEKREARQTLEDAKKRLARGADFRALAKELSDSDSAIVGGRVGCLNDSYGAGAQELLQEAGKLQEGKVSPILETVRGLHLLRLEGLVEEAEAEPLSRRYVARKAATEMRSKEAAKRFAEELIARVKKGEDLTEATNDLAASYAQQGPVKQPTGNDETHPALSADQRPKVQISRPFTVAQGPLPSALPTAGAGRIAFDLDKDGDVAEAPIETTNGWAVVQMKSKDLVTREAFNEEKLGLMSQLRSRKAEQALVDYVGRLREKAGKIIFNEKHVQPGDEKKPAES